MATQPDRPAGGDAPAAYGTPAGRPPSRRTAVAVAATYLLVLAVALGHLGVELRAQAAGQAGLDRQPRDHGQLVRPPFGGPGQGFAAFVAARVPAGQAIRIVMPLVHHRQPALEGAWSGYRTPPKGICGAGIDASYFWAVYALLPHPSVCAPDARFTVFVDVQPPSLPGGAHAEAYRPGYVLVDRGGGS
jgi:hypothetical protein